MKVRDSAVYNTDSLQGIEVSRIGPSRWQVSYRGRNAHVEAVGYTNSKPSEFLIERPGKAVSVARTFHTAIIIAASMT